MKRKDKRSVSQQKKDRLVKLSYCPLHTAAPALLEALKKAEIVLRTRKADRNYHQLVVKAIAHAEGRG